MILSFILLNIKDYCIYIVICLTIMIILIFINVMMLDGMGLFISRNVGIVFCCGLRMGSGEWVKMIGCFICWDEW